MGTTVEALPQFPEKCCKAYFKVYVIYIYIVRVLFVGVGVQASVGTFAEKYNIL